MKYLVLPLPLTFLVALPASPAQQPPPKLLIAFASYRERPKHPSIFFYEHDGLANGRIAGSTNAPKTVPTAEAESALTHDGRFCFFTFEFENKTARIHCWDRKEHKLVDLPGINDSPNALQRPSCSGDGKRIAFAGWSRPGGPGQGWHVFLYDRPEKKIVDLPNLAIQGCDDRMPALSGDGRFLAFTSNRQGGAGLTDIHLYDRTASKLVALPGLNSSHADIEPSMSHDGGLIAFTSERPDGRGGRDIYLFDRAAGKLLPLPGLNTAAHEYSPALSRDGRYIAFVSERVDGEGERDVFLYDRQAQKLLPTPGLNSPTEDFDPCVIVLTPGH
jgi:Tol biopolymer transport system component